MSDVAERLRANAEIVDSSFQIGVRPTVEAGLAILLREAADAIEALEKERDEIVAAMAEFCERTNSPDWNAWPEAERHCLGVGFDLACAEIGGFFAARKQVLSRASLAEDRSTEEPRDDR